MTGYWLQDAPELLADKHAPSFEEHDLPGDGIWHEVDLRFSESPLFFEAPPFRTIGLLMVQDLVDGTNDEVLEQMSVPAGGYLDVDWIELKYVPEPARVGATISRVSPSPFRQDELLTIEGSHFATPAQRNTVLLGGLQVDVLEGSPERLVVRPLGIGKEVTVKVLTPGGGTAVAPQTVTRIGKPRSIAVVSGGDQSAKAGSRLQPIVVRVSTGWDGDGDGVPREKVMFRIGSGDATIAPSETMTDSNGQASAVVTLGSQPGPIVILVGTEGLEDIKVLATAQQWLPWYWGIGAMGVAFRRRR